MVATVTSQAMARPECHGTNVIPSGLLTLSQYMPDGSLEIGMPAEAKDLAIIIIIHEYYYGGAVALLLQDHLTMSVTEQSQYLSATVQWEHETCPGVNPLETLPNQHSF